MNKENYLIDVIKTMYDALYSEYVACPTCTGSIGFENESHDDFCEIYKILKENNYTFKSLNLPSPTEGSR